MSDDYGKHFEEDSFWKKVRQTAAAVPFVLDTVALYYCMLDDKTPISAKVSIAAALGYFILPLDVIPDILVPVGFLDDAAMIASVITYVGSYLTEEHRLKAREAMDVGDPR